MKKLINLSTFIIRLFFSPTPLKYKLLIGYLKRKLTFNHPRMGNSSILLISYYSTTYLELCLTALTYGSLARLNHPFGGTLDSTLRGYLRRLSRRQQPPNFLNTTRPL